MKPWERGLDALKDSIRRLSPSGAFGLSFLCGLYAPDLLPPAVLALLFVSGCLITLYFSLTRRRWEKVIAWAALIAFVVALGYRHYETSAARKNLEAFRKCLSHLDQQKGGDTGGYWVGSVTGFIEKYPDKIMFLARVEGVFDQKGEKLFDGGSEGRVKVFVFIKEPLRRWRYGDKFITKSPVREFRNYRNPTPPFHGDMERTRLWRGTYGYVFMNDDRDMVLSNDSLSFYSKFFQWIDLRRQQFSDHLDKRISYPESAFLKAITVGYRKFIDQSWNDLTNKAGVQHLLAISGLHIASVAFFAFIGVRFALRHLSPKLFLIVPEPILSAFLSIPVVFCYAMLTGLAVPTQRALFSVMFIFCGLILYRRIDFLTIFSVVATILLLSDISFLYSPSFVLSFGAVGGIFWVALALRPGSDVESFDRVKSRTSRYGKLFVKIAKALFEILWVSLCVQVVLCPFLLYFFGRLSWAGVAANIVLVPYVSFLVLPVCLLLLGGFLISPLISDPLIGVAKLATALMLKIIKFFGSWDSLLFWGMPESSSEALAKFYIVFYLIVLAVVVRKLKGRNWNPAVKLAFVLSVALLYQGVIVISERGASPWLEATVLDVGDGSSTFIAFPNGRTALMDGGGIPKSSFDVGSQIVVPAIMASGFRHLDDVILSHYHYDHAKGLEFILTSFPVGRFMKPLCSPADESPDLGRIAMGRKLREISFDVVRESLEHDDHGGVKVEVIHPSLQDADRIYCSDLNRSSTVLKLSYGSTVFIIPSDVGKDQLTALLPALSRRDKEVLVLLAPHHGRCGSFDIGLFDAISPDVVIISAKRNSKVPCPGLSQWCKEKGILCFTTWDYGAIKIRSDGHAWTIYSMSDDGTFRLLGSAGRDQTARRQEP